MNSPRVFLPLAAALLAAVAVAVAHAGGPSSNASATSSPCGTRERPPARYRHVIWIIFENKSYDDVIGAGDAAYLNKLAKQCGIAANFHAETHPSAPNYVALASGGTHGLKNDADPIAYPINAPSIFSQLGRGGWRALIESMPSNCRTRYLLPEYYARHNAPAYFTNIRADCLKYDVPLRSPPNLSARLTYIAPNSCHSMHTCGVSAGDAWLGQFMPKVLSSPQYRAGRTAVFITWDEADAGDETNHIPTLVVAPAVRSGTVVSTRFDHYSLLRTTQELLGLRPFLGAAARAASMRPGFGI